MAEKQPTIILVCAGVGTVSAETRQLRTKVNGSECYEKIKQRLAVRHALSIEEMWNRLESSQPETIDEVVIQLAIQLAAADATFAATGAAKVILVGHSIGEIAAAVLAGHLDVEQAVDVAVFVAQVASTVPGGLVYGPIRDGDLLASINISDETSHQRIGAVSFLGTSAPDLDSDHKRIHTSAPWHHPTFRKAAELKLCDVDLSKHGPHRDRQHPLVSSLVGGFVMDHSTSDRVDSNAFWAKWTYTYVNLSSALEAVRDRLDEGKENATLVVELGASPVLGGAIRAALGNVDHVAIFHRQGGGFNMKGWQQLLTRCDGRNTLLQHISSLAAIPLEPNKTWTENGLGSADLAALSSKLRRSGAFPGLVPQDLYRFVSPSDLVQNFGTSEEPRDADPHERGDSMRHEVVIKAMSCVFPGNLNTPGQLGAFTATQGDAVHRDMAIDPTGRAAGYLSELVIDLGKFGLSRSEAKALDPQQALVLNCVQKLLDEHEIVQLPANTGVYIGAWNQEFEGDQSSVFYPTGTNPSLIAARVSHTYRLHGPCKVVNSACASSLEAVLEAFKDVASGKVDCAIAGGVNLLWGPTFSSCMAQSGFLAPGQRCRTLDASADGYVRAEGCGLVLLSRKNHEPYYAQVLGGASNHNGGRSTSITAPSPTAQEECIKMALADARISAGDVDYVECHGTGTKLGDPIEWGALANTIGRHRHVSGQPCMLASVKSNIGHLESAAGVAGLIHAVMVLSKKVVPRMGNFVRTNPLLEPCDGLCIATEKNLVVPHMSVAGVSSFGFGGSNVHLLLRVGSTIPHPRPPLASSNPNSQDVFVFDRSQRHPHETQRQRQPTVKVKVDTTRPSLRGGQNDNDETREIFWQVVRDVQNGIEAETGILESGLDSLTLTELFSRIEQRLGVQASELIDFLGGEFTWGELCDDVVSRSRQIPSRAVKSTKPSVQQHEPGNNESSKVFWQIVRDVRNDVEIDAGILESGIDSLALTELFLKVEQSLGVQASELGNFLEGGFTWRNLYDDVMRRSSRTVSKPSMPVNQAASSPASEVEDISLREAFTWPLSRFDGSIKTTHVGSLPRASETGQQYKDLHMLIRKQLEIGLSVINDGEVGRMDYASAVLTRMTGFEHQSLQVAPQPEDLRELPCVARRFLAKAGLITLNHSIPAFNLRCVDEIAYIGHKNLERNLESFRRAVLLNNAGMQGQVFWTAPSPGTLGMFFENHAKHVYPTYEVYLEALADALHIEYSTIVKQGFVLQVDCPDLAMSRHTRFKHLGLHSWHQVVRKHVDALNRALDGIPSEYVRVHVCWGNYAGTHHRDVSLDQILAQVFKINARGFGFEAANNRHGADWKVVSTAVIPQDAVLYPGVVDTCSMSVESPDLVCERICQFVKLVGPHRVVANTDCGFSTTAQSQGLPSEVVWMKLRALVAGARKATHLLFPKVFPAFVPRPKARRFLFSLDVLGACRAAAKIASNKDSFASTETRIVLTESLETDGKAAAKMASHVRLFVDTPVMFETDGSASANAFVKCVEASLADGERRNSPGFPTDLPSLPALSPEDMVIRTKAFPKSSYQVVIVGGGVLGLLAADRLSKEGLDVVVFEKQPFVGGIWTTFANNTSQVNSSEGSYRLIQEYRKRPNRDHSTTSEIRRDILELAQKLCDAQSLFTEASVRYLQPSGNVDSRGRKEYTVEVELGGDVHTVHCSGVLLTVNDRVGQPRSIRWKGQENFRGEVVKGFGGDAQANKVDWTGKRVVVVGMGAFAVENVRTALEGGARNVVVLARRHGTVCPKYIDYINFVHRDSVDSVGKDMDTRYNSKNMFLWRKLYESSHCTMPECWMELVKHTGHTISVSDVWFVGHHLGLLETRMGEIEYFTQDGVVVSGSKADEVIQADVVVQCTGFERNASVVPLLTPYKTMSSINYLDANVMYLADAFIDDAAFNSFFGSSVIEMAKFYIMVFHHFFQSQDKDGSVLDEPTLKPSIDVTDRKWSDYIRGAEFLVTKVEAIRIKANELLLRRTHDFLETQTVEEYLASNRREWIELHDLLSQGTLEPSAMLPYPDWKA